LTIAQDFVLTSSTPSQTVTAGQTSGAYNLRIQPVGSSFTGAVTLACTAGLPAGGQCAFNPSTPLTPGNSAVDVVMSISTAAKRAAVDHASSRPLFFYALWLLLPVMVVGSGASRSRWQASRIFSLVAMSLLMLGLLSCAGASSGGGGGNPPPNSVTYHVTVTGSSPGTPVDAGQSVVVNLVVNQ
jgi:hypothetical protein